MRSTLPTRGDALSHAALPPPARSQRMQPRPSLPTLVPRPVVAQYLRQPERLMPRSLPDLGAAGHAAGYLDVPATSRYGCRAVAWPPVDDDRARFPGVVVAAFVRESWPCRTAPCLLHDTFKHTTCISA